MNGLLKFSIEGLTNLYDEALKYQQNYSTSIANLDKEIANLGNNWTSNETGTYEEFVARDNEKKGKLQEADSLMLEFCNKVQTKAKEFEDATMKAKNAFK